MRRFTALAACLLMLVFGAVACSDDDNEPASTGGDTDTTEMMDDEMDDDMSDEDDMDDDMDDDEG